MIGLQSTVCIPGTGAAVAAVKDLDETHPTLDQSPRRQTQLPEIACRRLIQTVQPARFLRLPLELEHLRQRRLHTEGQLIRFDSCSQSRILGVFYARETIELAKQVEL